MKQSFRKVISLVLALVMLLSVGSVSFYSFAEETENSVSMPSIQTMLTDGKALKDFLESNFLNLGKADALLSDSLPGLSETLCTQLGDLFYQMGYAKEQYPNDMDSLLLALARAIGSLDAEVFKEPEKIETTDMSLVYNLAYLGGTEYIESINAALPENLRFDTSSPVLSLNAEQQQKVSEYYAKWKAGALHLDDFDIKDYLGQMTPIEYLKTVLLVFIADDARLPAISKAAVDFTMDAGRKSALANAVAIIMDNFTTAPVSAVVRVLSDSDFHALLKALIETANKVTVRTDYYSYTLFREGIFTDTDGSAIANIEANGDGTYSYIGPSMISAYMDTIDALLELLDGINIELNDSVLETVFSKRLDKLSELAQCALQAAAATVGAEQSKLQSDIDSAQIEIRFANKKIAEIDAGTDKQARINALQAQLDALAAEVASLMEQLSALEREETLTKDAVKGYYDALAEFEAMMTEENMDEITADPAYVAAKAKVEQTEASLADNYASQSDLKARIAQKSAQADDVAAQIEDLQNNYSAADAKTVYQKMITRANQVISDSREALAALPEDELVSQVTVTLLSLLNGFFKAFDGVYDIMLDESPVKAAVQLVYGLKDFVNAVENIDWDAIASVTDPIFAQIDTYIDSAAGRYFGANGGTYLLEDLSAMLNEFLDSYGVYNYINVDYLNTFISEEILGDNSDIMQAAAGVLRGMFPNVQPNYESIVSCLIPVLSAFSFTSLMSNLDNITAALGYASPSAFAYLAGLSDASLDSNYLNTINANLVDYGYEGEPLRPMISLSSSQQSSLLQYARMEQSGTDLATIAASGFNWENYVGGASKLELANAFVKMALGDSQKLGDIAATPGLGTALTKLLCDLFDDLKAKPVDTLLKKVSDSQTLAGIVDFAMGLLNGDDANYKSYDMFFTDNIYYDGEGNTTFYDSLDEEGVPQYCGPKAMEQYVPVIAAALDFLSGIDQDVQKNNGDLLKTLLYDKTPQLKNLIQSVISYEDETGNQKAGLLFYLFLGYGDYLQAENEILCYDVLISLANAAIRSYEKDIAGSTQKIDTWEQYLAQAQAAEGEAMLAKARELGVADDSVTAYDEEAVVAAIEAKIAALQGQIDALEAAVGDAQAAYLDAQGAAEASAATLEAAEALQDYPYHDPFYTDLCAIFDDQDLDLLDTLRSDCEYEFNEAFGGGKFDELAALIEEYLADYEGDTDTFIDDWMFSDGINIYGIMQEADDANTLCQEALAAAETAFQNAQENYDQSADALAQLEGGFVLDEIHRAGNGVSIELNNPDLPAIGEFTVAEIQAAIDGIYNESVAEAEAQIAAQNELIESYEQVQATAGEKAAAFNATLVPLAATASDAIAQGLIDVIMGNQADGSENIYNYIMNHNIVDILTTGGRLQAIFEMLVAIYGPALEALVSEGLLERETADQLIEAIPNFDSFYAGALAQFPDNFKQNPVAAVGELIGAITETVKGGFVAMEGEMTHDVLQIKKINSDVSDIFDAGFPQEWAQSYSKTIINRTGEIYQLIVDLLGLSFIKDLIEIPVGTTGELSGKVDTSKLFSDVTVCLYAGETLVASVEVKKDSDGAFRFSDVEEGRYSVKVEAPTGVSFEIKAIDIIADDTTDLTKRKDEEIALIELKLGDVDGNNIVNADDIATLLLEENFSSAKEVYDINCDGVVDIADVSIVLATANYGAQAETIVY